MRGRGLFDVEADFSIMLIEHVSNIITDLSWVGMTEN